ncbi:MAG: NAD(P)/FAD-dependent oxidoreductase [Psychroflexus sp.]|nr:NAD(P)/FAD-dependent oxidoreductase [Psychroflexus sp.]MDN6310936.1 NAD(P)/FAD-dependent oxidoreductase [Psychroflexus sp.]
MLDFVIIGAAQAGLSIAYELKLRGYSFIILDKENEIGASWLNRWDSLKLFTPAEFNNLKGLDFPAPKGSYPNKYEVADYFKSYVSHFDFPIQLNTLVTKVTKDKQIFKIFHDTSTIKSRHLIVATGPFHIPYIPRFSKNISDHITQLHSNFYKKPEQLEKGKTLVVGDGDSGYQILDEISRSTPNTVYFSGNTSVQTLPQEILGKTLWWWFTITGFLSISKDSWLGQKIINSRQPIIGTDVKAILFRQNVVCVGHTVDANQTEVITEKEVLKDLRNIVWATGYRPNFKWIKGLELDKDNYPAHKRGVSHMKGLFFIGLPWLHTRASATLGGVKEDAEYLVNQIEKHSQKEAAQEFPEAATS